MKKPMKIIKTIEQIERKYKRVYKTMRRLNDPRNYEGRELTSQEWVALEKAVSEWEMLSWLTGKYSI